MTDTTAHTTHSHQTTPSPDLLVQGGGLVGALLAVVYVVSYIIRRVSHDRLEIKRDTQEGDLLALALRERNDAQESARMAWEARAEDAKEIGRLSAQVEGLALLNHKTNNEVQLLRILNEKLNQEITQLRQELADMREKLSEVLKMGGDHEEKDAATSNQRVE